MHSSSALFILFVFFTVLASVKAIANIFLFFKKILMISLPVIILILYEYVNLSIPSLHGWCLAVNNAQIFVDRLSEKFPQPGPHKVFAPKLLPFNL